MRQYHGVGVSPGVAIGPLQILLTTNKVEPYRITDPVAEVARFHCAQAEAVAALAALNLKAVERVGQAEAEIFNIHAMLVTDPDYTDAVEALVSGEFVCAEYAVQTVSQQHADLFSAMDDAYMKERAGDFLDVGQRIVSLLCRQLDCEASAAATAHILAAEDLLPSQTIQLDPASVLAFVTRAGSTVSHTAILARNMGIPAVVGVDLLSPTFASTLTIVDGDHGLIIQDPEQSLLQEYRTRQEAAQQDRAALQTFRDQPSVTLDGYAIELCANIGSPSNLADAIENGAEGIGLFRSEFLYMESKDFPTEQCQYEAYRTVLAGIEGKRVIIRTLDLGADKHVPYFQFPQESNPALGCRAIRLCLRRRDIFLTQLRALLRASAHGRLGIMIPMVCSLDEVKESRALLEQAKLQLDSEGISYQKNVEFGVMIETPAAAIISDQLAKEVDFFSIGTNDLTQYTLAADRMNSNLGTLYNPAHPAVLRLIRTTVENAHQAGIWVGICGESAADQTLLPFYLSIGVDELSVSPKSILPLRRAVSATTRGEGVEEARRHG